VVVRATDADVRPIDAVAMAEGIRL
jgi:hypothetical protein